VGVNRTGTDPNGNSYAGNSSIYAPDGGKLTSETRVGNLEIFELDISKIEELRSKFNTVKDRRTSLYKSFM
jgi:predicted amidohydrolase